MTDTSFERSLDVIRTRDTIRDQSLERAESEKDDAEIALKALDIFQTDALDACWVAINTLANQARTKEGDRKKALEVMRQELCEITWDRRQELEREIERCGEVIERAERPDGPVVL